MRTVIVDPKPIDDDREAIGDIRPRYETDLGFRVAGKLVARLVDLGDEIKKGVLLARLDEQDFKTTIQSARADVASAQAILTEAKADERRKKSLLAKRITSRANYDTALRTLRTSRAKLASTKAALALARDQLGYTKIYAEYDGIVTGIGAESGQVVVP